MARREARERQRYRSPTAGSPLPGCRDLREGDVQPLHYFGEDLVLFRTRSGEAQACSTPSARTSAPTSATGAGWSARERSAAPSTAWQFDGATRQTAPTSPTPRRSRRRARVRSWDVQEKNGMVFVWRHSRETSRPSGSSRRLPKRSDTRTGPKPRCSGS